MKYALDKNGNRIYIAKAFSEEKYFCPICGKSLIQRKGDLRDWHFAHKDGICQKEEPSAPQRDSYTIPALWNKVHPVVMIVKNRLSSRKFRIHDDPNVTAYKYNRCYGYMSDKDGNFNKENKKTEIYSWDKPIWEMLWYK